MNMPKKTINQLSNELLEINKKHKTTRLISLAGFLMSIAALSVLYFTIGAA